MSEARLLRVLDLSILREPSAAARRKHKEFQQFQHINNFQLGMDELCSFSNFQSPFLTSVLSSRFYIVHAWLFTQPCFSASYCTPSPLRELRLWLTEKLLSSYFRRTKHDENTSSNTKVLRSQVESDENQASVGGREGTNLKQQPSSASWRPG